MIRKPTTDDHEAIAALLDLAFQPSKDESRLRELVVAGSEPYSEWLVEHEGQVIAYVLYTQASDSSSAIGYHLAPVAVHPNFQGYGIGSQLICDTLDREPIRNESIFVLGDPGFYERFGFTRVSSTTCPFDQGNQHFRALRWDEPSAPFIIGYVPAFAQAITADQPCPA